ncbi:MAG TPA: PSD1 and planctomycete cytochrome C domain-containing protein, partial [Verrucomicrobiae bacterium]|nr:PSD1 and planctomycete cytochrome C domain-containing protein [Verrucomicrobiae bacterium]
MHRVIVISARQISQSSELEIFNRPLPQIWRRVLARGIVAFIATWNAIGAETPNLPPAANRSVDFSKDIKPIFEVHCVKCHGPDKQKSEFRLDRKEPALKGGENHAPDILPGKSAESPLIQFVSGVIPEMKMPQKGEPLSAQEIGLLRAWIDQGANWPEESKADQTHWSLKPVERPTIPAGAKRGQGNPIDAFVFARLAENKLTPSREADRRTLIRRAYFDLLGLPPAPEEVRKFEQDKSPEAYEKLVDSLLASPHYGERWARHWLDVVRFAETTGFEVNTPRPNAWPYRDYVIRAFNDDKRYDQFILEQIAGDILGEDAATGFLVAGPDDKVKSPDPVLTANQRADELHDMVSTTGSTFLGLTVGCARCHNHKFDPIPQTDYYAMRAVFEGVQHGDRKMKAPDTERKENELAERRKRLAEIDAALAQFEPIAQVTNIDTNRLRASVHPRWNVERFAPVTASKLRFTIARTTDAEPCIDELEVFTTEEPPRNIALASAGTKGRASSVFPNSEIHRLEHLNDGKYGNSRSWISNERGQGWVELEFPERVTINRIIWGRDREQKFADRLALDYRIEVLAGSNDWHIVGSSADRRPYVAGRKQQPELSLAGLTAAQATQVKKLAAERAEQETRIAELSKAPTIYGGTFVAQPEPTHRLQRGDPMQKREVVAPAALEAVPVRFDLQKQSSDWLPDRLKPGLQTEDQKRRLALAQWIADPANPLTSRVMVNRIWQYHFGEGLVSTPSDFGANGARPSHPKLLDWLAAELVAPSLSPGSTTHAWSLKHIHRLILTSATYRL